VGFQVTADLTAVSYATSDQADDVAELRVNGAAWLALDSDQKDAAMATASRDIDSIAGTPPGTIGGFIGERASPDQSLEWPRTGTDYDDTAWPQRLVDATIELAISYAPAFAAGSDVLNPSLETGTLKSSKVGPIEKEWFAPRSADALSMARLPAMVQRLLAPLVLTDIGNVWGSGSVARGS
jgi:hypothetical protein